MVKTIRSVWSEVARCSALRCDPMVMVWSSSGILAGIVTRSVGLPKNKVCLMPRQLYLSNLRVHFDCRRRTPHTHTYALRVLSALCVWVCAMRGAYAVLLPTNNSFSSRLELGGERTSANNSTAHAHSRPVLVFNSIGFPISSFCHCCGCFRCCCFSFYRKIFANENAHTHTHLTTTLNILRYVQHQSI